MSGATDAMPRPVRRALTALPDAITAGFFLWIWMDPRRFGEGSIRAALLIMLVEFILIHATGLLGGFTARDRRGRGARLVVFGGMGLVYALFIGVLVVRFNAWWPVLAFGWLFVGKLVSLVRPGNASGPAVEQEQQARWGYSVLCYIASVALGIWLPLPRLGITPEVVTGIDPGGDGGLWVEQPHRLLAAGVLYFIALFILKLTALDDRAAKRMAAGSRAQSYE
jgi:hypothetical protein